MIAFMSSGSIQLLVAPASVRVAAADERAVLDAGDVGRVARRTRTSSASSSSFSRTNVPVSTSRSVIARPLLGRAVDPLDRGRAGSARRSRGPRPAARRAWWGRCRGRGWWLPSSARCSSPVARRSRAGRQPRHVRWDWFDRNGRQRLQAYPRCVRRLVTPIAASERIHRPAALRTGLRRLLGRAAGCDHRVDGSLGGFATTPWRGSSQDAWLTVDMLKSGIRSGGIAVRRK